MKAKVLARCLALFGAAACLPAVAAPPDEPPMRPFVLRWDDTEPTVLDLSFLSPGEAGANGPVLVSDDGYLTTGGERLKLFGNNTGPGQVFADIDDATRDAVAGRMRKFGYNAIRFHHLGASWTDRNAFGEHVSGQPNESTKQIDAESLDRIHRWFASYKRHGIYTNMNLLVSRTFRGDGDGLPASMEDVPWKLQGAIAMWHPAMIELQKEYARQLLSPENPHTGSPMATDPALATVEINNENGILHTWLGGELDDVPEDLAEPLRQMWNDWLAEKYADDQAVAEAWGARDVPPGDALIDGDDEWNLNINPAAAASLKQNLQTGERSIVIDNPGGAGWHVQYTRPVALEGGEPYTLTFRAKADAERSVIVAARMNHEPWTMIGLEKRIALTPEFQEFSIVFVPTVDDPDPRIEFGDLAQEGASYTFADLSLKPGGRVGGETALGDIPISVQGGDAPMTLAQRRDWFAFCMDAERAYFGEMKRFLNDDLGVVAPVVGTIVGCSPMGVQKEMDAIDTHAYWRHPSFPGEPWDADNWTVEPDSMVNFPETSAILGPMLKQVRVDGKRKPHMLTEYDHPAPNPHAGEGPLFLAAYAALQDFDAVYLFSYDIDFDAEPGRITGFFDTASNPVVVANTIPAALMFRRGDVQPAEQEAVVGITEEQELDALVERGAAWSMVDYDEFTDQPLAAYVARVAVNFGNSSQEANESHERMFGAADEAFVATGLMSSGGIIQWARDPGRLNNVSVNSANQMMILGNDGSGMGNPTVTVERTAGDREANGNWRYIAMPLLEGNHLKDGPKRALLVATGNYANTGWQWKSDAHNSLGSNWGTAPTLVEVVPVTLTLKADNAARAWALDAVGRRVEEVAVEMNDGVATLRVGPGHTETATLFYEVEWE